MHISHTCANCLAHTRCRRRDFSPQAWAVLVLWGEVGKAAVDQPSCDTCYDDLRDVLIDRSQEIETALTQPAPQPQQVAQAAKAVAAQPVKTSKPQPVKASKPQPVKASKPQPVKASKPQPAKVSKPQSAKKGKPQPAKKSAKPAVATRAKKPEVKKPRKLARAS